MLAITAKYPPFGMNREDFDLLVTGVLIIVFGIMFGLVEHWVRNRHYKKLYEEFVKRANRIEKYMITDTIDSNDGVLYRFHRNSDYSGSTIITVPAEDIEGGVGTTKLVTIPFEVLRSYVQGYQRYRMIRELEEMDDDDFDRYQTMQCRNDE